jgi:hypothetical protein
MSCKRIVNVEKKRKPLLRLLCLHGYRQNEMAFRERTGGLRKFLKNQAEFVFCEAPHTIPISISEQATANPETQTETTNGAAKAWWFSSQDSEYNACLTTDCDKGFDSSLQYIDSVFKSNGPFDGFSSFLYCIIFIQ